MDLNFAFVVRNLESDIDSRWIDLSKMSEEEARAEWDRIVDYDHDWEIVDLECNFSINYYDYQYASFETLYEAYEILERAADNDMDALIAEYILYNGGKVTEIHDDGFVIFAGSDDSDLGYAVMDEFGFESVSLEMYFDFESFGRDLRLDSYIADVEEDDPDYADMLMDMDDEELGEHYVDAIGGVGELSRITLEMYFDYDRYGHDLSFDYTFVSVDDIEGWVLI